jgi:hypothetical protein
VKEDERQRLSARTGLRPWPWVGSGRGRLVGEPAWTSLRWLVDIVGPPDRQEALKSIQRVVFETPALLAVYLQRLHGIQDAVVDTLLDRAEAAGTPYAPDDPAPRALTAAAFGRLAAAQHAWLASATSDSLASYIDRAMATITPAPQRQRHRPPAAPAERSPPTRRLPQVQTAVSSGRPVGRSSRVKIVVTGQGSARGSSVGRCATGQLSAN